MLFKGAEEHMVSEVEEKMTEFMRPLFGDMAQKTIENQKEKLDLSGKSLTNEQYVEVAESIRDLCKRMAGNAIADKIYTGLMEILEAEA